MAREVFIRPAIYVESCLERATAIDCFGKRSYPSFRATSKLNRLCEKRPAGDRSGDLCGVTLLQFMEKVADRRAAEQVVYHLGWKYALDLELPYEGFHPTVLVYFRDRLEENKAERVIFDGWSSF